MMGRRGRRIALGIGLGALAVIGIALGLRAPPEDGALARVRAGSQAPVFRAVTLDSIPAARTLADYAGQVVLLNVWATWCAPCIDEMPSMQRLYEEYGDKGLRIVAISVDDRGSETLIRDFVKEYGLTFDILHDTDGDIYTSYQLNGVPQTFLIDRAGVIRLTRYAEDWMAKQNREAVAALLED